MDVVDDTIAVYVEVGKCEKHEPQQDAEASAASRAVVPNIAMVQRYFGFTQGVCAI